jgi:hypothetical protein
MRRAAAVAKTAPASQKTLDQVAELNKLARAVFTRGYNDSDLSACVGVLRELRHLVELEGRILGTVEGSGARINIELPIDKDALARMAGAFLAVQRRETGALPPATRPLDVQVVRSDADDVEEKS